MQKKKNTHAIKQEPPRNQQQTQKNFIKSFVVKKKPRLF